MPTSLKQLLAQLESLDDDFMVFSGRKKPPTAAAVKAMEKALGAPLSPQHRELVLAMGCLAVLVKPDVWPRPKELDVRPAWQFQYGFEVFGIAAEATALDAVAQRKARAAETKAKLVPALRWITDRICLGYGKDGEWLEWERGHAPAKVQGHALFDVISGMLKTLATDKEKMKAEVAKMARAKKVAANAPDPLLVRLLDDDDLDDHLAACEAFAKLRGARQKAIVDALLAAVEGPTPSTVAIGALGSAVSDRRALDALIELTHAKNAEVRGEAFSTLGLLESRPAAAVPALIAALSDRDDDVRHEAIDALGEYAHPDAVEPLLAALRRVKKSRSWQTHGDLDSLFMALGACGKDDPRVVDLLTAHLVIEPRYSGLAAFRALAHLGRRAARARPALEACLANGDAWREMHARIALVAMGEDVGLHAPRLVEGLAHNDTAVQAVADIGLGHLGERARPFVKSGLKAKRASVRKKAAAMLQQLDAQKARASKTSQGKISRSL